ncbi:MAG: MFS transporter [Clostridia bacterium]|nr:MFS transporter [Clostridia bacterium]
MFSLVGQIAWVVENMYFNVFIYKMFNASAADISAMVAASAATATLTTIFIGALSDRIGKRKLFITAGCMLWGISIFSFVFLRLELIEAIFPLATSAATIGVSLTIVLDCLMTFFGSSANDAAFNAWVTDSTDSTNRGAAEGINSMMPLVAILVVFGGFMFFDLEQSKSWVWIFSIIGTVVFLIGLVGLFLIKEPAIKPNKEPYLKSILYGFRPATIKKNPTLYASLLAFIVFNISIQIFMPYLILYYEKSLGMSNYVLIMAPAIILASVVTFLWGRVYDKKGFFFSGIFALLFLACGYCLLFGFRATPIVFIGSLLMMSGYLAGMAVFGATIRDNTPLGKAGLLQGVRIFSQVFIPGIVGPYIGSFVLRNAETIRNSDGTTSFLPNRNIFLAALIALLLILPLLLLIFKTKKQVFATLKTPFEPDMDPICPFSEYPRPQLRRDSYFCLNGEWDFAVRGKKETTPLGKILVPFPPESRLSGIERTIGEKELMLYFRTFSLPKGFRKERVILHFGAADQYTAVYVNDRLAGKHAGGYLPFSFDITDLLIEGKNTLRAEIADPLDPTLSYGKQRKKRGGMWYTPIGGIWQTVWMESVPASPITALRMTSTLSGVTIEVEGGLEDKKLILKDENGVKEYCFTGKSIQIEPEQPRLWSPEDPYLYRFTLESGEDRIQSYFALRTVDVRQRGERSYICLNGEPYFFHGLLDQGYFSDGIYLPATEDGYKHDILKMKECGFNTLRKHIKLEPELFYYYCDRYGMIVFQDMINSGKYHFILDTAIPTVWLRRGITHRASKQRKAEFYRTFEQMQRQLYNHPSVCYYTIFNEGWGQFSADRCYTDFKAKDPTRIYDTTSGWFKTKKSDVESDHIYFKPVRLKAVAGKPMVLSEFGGYSCRVKNHTFNLSRNTGYHFFTEDPSAFEAELIALYDREILPMIRQGLNASILTQISDVEDETNGIMTYDRAVLKTEPAEMQDMADRLKKEFKQSL